MSQSMNPDTEIKKAVLVDQMSTTYWAFVLQGAQVLESPQIGPPMAIHQPVGFALIC